MTTWELIPKTDRPDAQVLLTLPNGETEFIDGFHYQEFRERVAADGQRFLAPAGPPHTRYRYLPRRAGTYTWQHRTPPGGILEQGAFAIEVGFREASGALSPDEGPSSAETVPLSLPLEGEELSGLRAAAAVIDEAAGAQRLVRVPIDDPCRPVLRPDGEPDLVRLWVLDALLRAAEVRGAGVVLQLPRPAGPESSQLYTALFPFVCRFSAMPALTSWEVPASAATAEAARQFLRAYDPHHPVLVDDRPR